MHSAIRELDSLRRSVAESQSSQATRKKKIHWLTLPQLQEHLSKELASGDKRDSNTAFEANVLGWAQPKCLAKGNPKHNPTS